MIKKSAMYNNIKRKIFQQKIIKSLNTDFRKRVIVFNTPNHGNLGDQAISLAQQQWISKYLNEYIYIEISHDDYYQTQHILHKYIKSTDLIMINGGGYLGSLWPKEQKIVMDILEQFRNNKIVIFPQTVYFEESKYRNKQIEEMKLKMKNCQKVKLLVRDLASKNFIIDSKILDEDNVEYVPDIATFLSLELKQYKRSGVLFCLRSDKEKVENSQVIEIQQKLKSLEIPFDYSDTVIPKTVSYRMREKEVTKKFAEFKKHKVVVTDRLHGMIFAALTGTPCIAFDNLSGKVSGVYEWIKRLEYINCYTGEFNWDDFNKIYESDIFVYENDYLEMYYKRIEEICREE